MRSSMLLHPHQKKIISEQARFNVIRGGRRGGKTLLETEKLAFKAVSKANQNVFYLAPTQIQARSIIWEALKTRLVGIGDANEQRLEMKVPSQDGGTSTIKVAGWENRENFRGQAAHHITFDETDTMRNFFLGWEEIFRPALIDTNGTADFVGTPQKENANLRRLEKQCEKDIEWKAFHFTSWDNPTLARQELEKLKENMDNDTYLQEIMAEYVENAGALFHFDALLDVFTNTIDKQNEKFLIVDIADDGSDRTVFSFWEGLEETRRERFARLNTEEIIAKIREYAAGDHIPYSNIAVDAIGVGAGVASSSLLDGIIGYKSSYAAIRTDENIVMLPNVHYLKDAPLTSEYRNLRAQCIFTLADQVNNHKIASRVSGEAKERIIEELSTYQDASAGDGKRSASAKEDVSALLGRSPDDSDTWIMRMYFVVRGRLVPGGEEASLVRQKIQNRLAHNVSRVKTTSTR
jgi:hypothetical protein